MKPDVPQRPEKNCEISSTSGREQAGDILNENPSARSNKLIGEAGELEEEAGTLAGESCSSSDNGEVLAGEAAAEEINTPSQGDTAGVHSRSGAGESSSVQSKARHVLEARDSGPVLGEDASTPFVLLALEDDPMASSLEAEIEAADA